MIVQLEINERTFTADLNKPLADLSLAVSDVARAWYIDAPTFTPVVLGDWTGSVAAGGSVNFFNIGFNPHAHGTHTETAGHITKERHSINKHFNTPMSVAAVLHLTPKEGLVTFESFQERWKQLGLSETLPQAVIIKTDFSADENKNYSGTDWPFLQSAIGAFLREQGVDHLLIDQPSVDKEEDGGALACHHSFWGPTPEQSLHRTITELIQVPAEVCEGLYLLNLQVAPIDSDAAPSRPLLYALK